MWHHLVPVWEEMSTVISYKPVQASSSTPLLYNSNGLFLAHGTNFAVQLQLCLRPSLLQETGWRTALIWDRPICSGEKSKSGAIGWLLVVLFSIVASRCYSHFLSQSRSPVKADPVKRGSKYFDINTVYSKVNHVLLCRESTPPKTILCTKC